MKKLSVLLITATIILVSCSDENELVELNNSTKEKPKNVRSENRSTFTRYQLRGIKVRYISYSQQVER